MFNNLRRPFHNLKSLVICQHISVFRLSHKCESKGGGLNEFHSKLTGKRLSKCKYNAFIRRRPQLSELTKEELNARLNELEMLKVDVSDVTKYYHVLVLKPHLLHTRIRILRESGFNKITFSVLNHFYNDSKKKTIAQFKNEGLIRKDVNVLKHLHSYFKEWPETHPISFEIDCDEISVLDARLIILQKYLEWKLSMSRKEFNLFLKKYYSVKYKTFVELQETIDLEMNVIKFTEEDIKKNGCIISNVAPDVIKEILSIKKLVGIDIRTVIRRSPNILLTTKNNILKLDKAFKDFNIKTDSLQKCLKPFSYSPDMIIERLQNLSKMPEFHTLLSNPRFPELLPLYDSAAKRIEELRLRKSCYPFAILVASERVYQHFLDKLGSSTNNRDIAAMICSNLDLDIDKYMKNNADGKKFRINTKQMDFIRITANKFRRHNYSATIAPKIVYDNVFMLKKYFSSDVIYNNCMVLLYPREVIEELVNNLKRLQSGKTPTPSLFMESIPSIVDFACLDDDTILNLVLYAIERQYQFSDKGVWVNHPS